jgi:hypothetical protein
MKALIGETREASEDGMTRAGRCWYLTIGTVLVLATAGCSNPAAAAAKIPHGTHVDDVITGLGKPDWETAVTDEDVRIGFCPSGSVKLIGYRERPLLPVACKEVTHLCLDAKGTVVNVSNGLAFGPIWPWP